MQAMLSKAHLTLAFIIYLFIYLSISFRQEGETGVIVNQWLRGNAQVTQLTAVWHWR